MAHDELLYFKRSPALARLIVFDLAPQCCRSDLWPIFSQFGAVQSLDVVSGLAFVNYYTCAAAKAALSEIGSKSGSSGCNPGAPMLYGVRLNVRPRKSAISSDASGCHSDANNDDRRGFLSSDSDYLSIEDAITMANYFLGFNSWSTKVLELQELLPDVEEDANVDDDKGNDAANNKGGNDNNEMACAGSQGSEGRSKPLVFREVSNTCILTPEDLSPVAQVHHPQSSNAAASHLQPVPEDGSSQRSHWFAVVLLEVTRFRLAIKGQAYGLAACSTRDEAIGLAKKAAVSLARATALRRVCLVMLNGVVRWAVKMPAEPIIETSIVWHAPEPRPARSELPCMCTDTEGLGSDDDDADDNDNVGSFNVLNGSDSSLDQVVHDSHSSRKQLQSSLQSADVATPLPRAEVGNWRLAHALRTSSVDEEAVKRARLLDGLESRSKSSEM